MYRHRLGSRRKPDEKEFALDTGPRALGLATEGSQSMLPPDA